MAKKSKAKRPRKTPRPKASQPKTTRAKPSRPKRTGRRLARPRAIRHPVATDFDVIVQVGKRTVSVKFRPTNSHYRFRFTPDPKSRTGIAIAPDDAEDYVSGTADAGAYEASEVAAMAASLATAAAKEMSQ